MKRSARITINTQALQHNLMQAKQAAPHCKILAVIKANAYGHGMLSVAECLHDVDGYAVSCLPEAITLRDHQQQHPILVLQGHQHVKDLMTASRLKLRLVIHDEAQLPFLDQLGGYKVQLAIKLDTGMHRLGIDPQYAIALYKRLTNHANVEPDIWLMTHLSCADDLGSQFTSQQLQCFQQHTESINTSRSIANSAGILGWKKSHADWIRPGIMLYGSSPFNDPQHHRDHYHLKAVMTFKAPIISIYHLQQGDPIGYGASYHCPTEMRVAAVACGYADGYPRHAKTGTPVAINGVKTHLLGRVSMDMIVINLQHISAQVGDLVELWGEQIRVDDVAEAAETISYELLCNAGNHCDRV